MDAFKKDAHPRIQRRKTLSTELVLYQLDKNNDFKIFQNNSQIE